LALDIFILKQRKKIPTSEYHNCHVVVLLMGTILEIPPFYMGVSIDGCLRK